ncbi:MAG: ATP-dependent 6-phosphofructokinase, partial [Finegoldia magna]|nr:ATP-dependent 6-phosphofructokinase [Finegoldia magna]
GQNKGAQILKDFGIDGLVVLGGDGSFKGASALSKIGISTIGIPCTIDNDMGYTDYTIGFFTAVETVSDAISKLRDTSSSHGRANIIEVMGRNCGDIALYSGVASGAESILVPEVELNIDEVTEKIERGRKRGKLHHLIMLAEGVGGAYDIKNMIEEKTGVETKVTILGHVQRGGTPCTFDRLMATQMGNLAVKLIMEEKTDLAIAMKDNKIITVPIDEAVATKRNFREDLYEISKEISI